MRTIRHRPLGIFALVTVLSAAAAESATAQVSRSLPAPGTWGLAFALPGGGGSGVGLRRMIAPERSLGLDLRLGVSRRTSEFPGATEERSQTVVGVGADLRLYRRTEGPVVPFVQPAVSVEHADADGTDTWSATSGLSLGAEWLVLDQVSVSATAGAGVSWRHSPHPQRTDTTWSLALFRSGLALTLYF